MITQADGLVVERVGSDLVVFVAATNEAHALNETSALIFEMCDGASDRAQMVDALARVGLPADEAIVDLALAELTDASLVVVQGAGPRAGLTRRAIVRRLGLSATLIALLPVVETVVVQPAAAQTSGPPTTTFEPP